MEPEHKFVCATDNAAWANWRAKNWPDKILPSSSKLAFLNPRTIAFESESTSTCCLLWENGQQTNGIRHTDAEHGPGRSWPLLSMLDCFFFGNSLLPIVVSCPPTLPSIMIFSYLVRK